LRSSINVTDQVSAPLTPIGKLIVLKYLKRNLDSVVGSEQIMWWTIQFVLAEAAGFALLRNVPTNSAARPVPRIILVWSKADGM
jgi:hypothetical protein